MKSGRRILVHNFIIKNIQMSL